MAHRWGEGDSWRRYVAREDLVSTMNATEWRELTEAMRLLPGGPPGFRLKDIQGTTPWPDGSWDREWTYHPHPWESIEWLEIQPDPRQSEIMAILKAYGIPFSLEDGQIRVWGWLRRGAAPTFI